MITIKDVAAHAEISPSTVSIVLKGNGDARKISKETQKKVLESAKILGYTPNIQAKVLRGGADSSVYVTLFWASDIRVHILSRFLDGLQAALLKNNYPCEILIKPYKNDYLHEAMSDNVLLGCNGIILCNASEKDLAFLEQTQFYTPIVLYNRYSNQYPSVNMDDKTIGSIPARVFARHNKKRPAILKSPATFNGMNIRTNIFEYQSYESGMELPLTIMTTDSMRGGYDGAEKLIHTGHQPDCLLCTSDNIAFGALKAFYKHGIQIPSQLEIISISNGSPDQEEFSIPSLSVINLPMEEMAAECLKMVYNNIIHRDLTITSSEFKITYIPRESCPE